jgi:hypothetical protein
MPLLTWFWAILLVAHDKRGVSAVFLSRKLEISYPIAWLMLHKIRKATGDRDAHYQLAGLVELDDVFFGAPTEGGKRGRGMEQTPVLATVSLDRKRAPQYVKMKVIPNQRQDAGRYCTAPYRARCYHQQRCLQLVSKPRKERLRSPAFEFDAKGNPDHLKWLHTMISNAKAFIGGTYHGLASKHLQSYLDEFCFRTNRRRFEGQLFNRLLISCVSTDTITYQKLTS